MKILVLGAAGFIGSNLCRSLLSKGNEVVGADNLSTGYLENMPVQKNFAFIQSDIRSDQRLNALFHLVKPDVCYCLAAYASEGRSNYIRSFIHENNTVGTANVINCCLNYSCKLVFTSVAVDSGLPPFDETVMPNPVDEYGLSKWMSERSIVIANKEHGLEYCIIRPRNVYGPHQSLWDGSRNVIGIWCYQALHGLPLTIYGDGSSKRSFTFIDDILIPLSNAMTVKNKTINLGSRAFYSVLEASQIFREVTGYEKVTHLEARPEVAEAFCDTILSRMLLNYQPKTSFKEGIAKMWEWAKLQPERELITPPKLEISKAKHSSIL